MNQLPVCSSSKWSAEGIESFLEAQRIPVRLASNGPDGYPLICSLWFAWHDGCLWCATHESAVVAKLLKQDPKCAFEVATNDIPYKGVRGKGRAELLRNGADGTLKELIARYLSDGSSTLANWLMSRVEQEYVIRITPDSVTSWDFSERMAD
jgi:nitroimidazol reductase NimA-like FMN-containing flavoprotein (pyridoxamine 5'-phosphate oxidase superfamily)